jgi:DNA-binding IclR family transcriptional regulator
VARTSVDLHFQPGDPAHAMLTLFLDGGEHSVSAIADFTGLGVVECTRRADELKNIRLLDDAQPGYYRAGIALRLNAGWFDGDGSSKPDVLSELAAITGGSAWIGTLHGSGVSFLQIPLALGMAGQSRRIGFGSIGPECAHQLALGQVLLAYAGNGAADELLAKIPAGGDQDGTVDPNELQLSLSVVRLSGVAMTRSQPPTLEIAVPVFGPEGQVQTALQISAGGFQSADGSALEQLRRIASGLSRTRDELPS